MCLRSNLVEDFVVSDGTRFKINSVFVFLGIFILIIIYLRNPKIIIYEINLQIQYLCIGEVGWLII